MGGCFHCGEALPALPQQLSVDGETRAVCCSGCAAAVRWIRDHNRDAEFPRLPVPNFAAGGVATPVDAALLMQLGAETVFVGSGVFKSSDPEVRARAVVRAVANFEDARVIAEVSEGLGQPMRGLDVASMPDAERLAGRGW